jgi:hypothetical protein
MANALRAFIENGNIHIYGQNTSPAGFETYQIVKASDFSVYSAIMNLGTSSNQSAWVDPINVIPAGDGTWHIITNFASTFQGRRTVKVNTTNIQGIAWTTAANGATVLVRDTEPGRYKLSTSVAASAFPVGLGALDAAVVQDATTVTISGGEGRRKIN